MMRHLSPRAFALVLPLVLAAGTGPTTRTTGVPPKVGEAAPDLSLDTLDGTPVRLADLRQAGPVVVVQLRGWVGYQCPICTRQVGDLIGHAKAFGAAGASVVLVYPGPADGLQQHAEDFIAGKGLPENFRFVTDPGLTFVNAWGLRWDHAGETAYPATFVVNADGTVRFAQVSRGHGGRASAAQVLTALAARP